MHRLLVRGFFPFVIGASLLAGCATKDEFRTTQSTADAARMQADEARAARYENPFTLWGVSCCH